MTITQKKIDKNEMKRYQSEFNRTHLSVETAMQRVQLHRDYIAHAARYSHVVGKYILSTATRKLNNGDGPKILDIGCGPELQFLNSLHCNRAKVSEYLGLEAANSFKENGLKRLRNTVLSGKSNSIKNVVLESKSDFLTYDFGENKTFDSIICLEVVEHVQPHQTTQMLMRSRHLMHEGSVMWVSTPCYDEKTGAADNHPNEITYTALGALMEDIGFQVEEKYGTFASQKDYKHMIGDKENQIPTWLYNKLKAYYDTTLISNIFAPVVGPEYSRNCLWKLTKNQTSRTFPNLADVEGPWTNNENWKNLMPG